MKILINRKTKVRFAYSENLLKLNPNMEVYDTALDEPAKEEPVTAKFISDTDPALKTPEKPKATDPATDQKAIMIGDVSIHDADKKELVEYLEMAFGEKLQVRATKQDHIDRIIELSA